MKVKFSNKYMKWGFTAFFVIAASICFYYLIFHISSLIKNIQAVLHVFSPVIIGLILAYLMAPILNFIEKKILNPLFEKLKLKKNGKHNKAIRGLGITFTFLLVFVIIYLLIAMLVSQIVPSIRNIITNFDSYISNFNNWLNNVLENNEDVKNTVMPIIAKTSEELENWLNDTKSLMEKSGEILKTVSLGVVGFFKTTWNVLLGLIISVYFLASKEIFTAQSKKVIYSLFERHTANKLLRAFRFTNKTFIGFFGGKIVDSIIIGLLCFIGTTILGTPYAALVSVVVGVTNIIPVFGPYLGAVPSAVLILVADIMHPLNCVYFVIFIIVLQQVDGNIIGPKILGNSTGLSSFWVIVAISVFGGFFGIPGMIVGVPICAVIYAACKYQINRSLRNKKYSDLTADYVEMDSIDSNGNFRLKKDMVGVVAEEEEEKDKEENNSFFKRIFGSKNDDDKDKLIAEEDKITSFEEENNKDDV